MNLLVYRRRSWACSLILLCLLPIPGQSSHDRSADLILGRWFFPAKQSSIELYRTGDRYFGRIADVSRTGQQQLGITKNQLIISNLAFNGTGWSGGELIHPKTGAHFDVELKLKDHHTLTAKVYKGCRWLHKEYVLKRQSI